MGLDIVLGLLFWGCAAALLVGVSLLDGEVMAHELDCLCQQWVRRIDGESSGGYIANLQVHRSGPDVPLTAEQAVRATVAPAGSYGCSRVTFQVTVEVECQGLPDQIREYFAQCLLKRIHAQGEELRVVRMKELDLLREKSKREADDRAAAVVESARIATLGTGSER